jgi:hypothetical protein
VSVYQWQHGPKDQPEMREITLVQVVALLTRAGLDGRQQQAAIAPPETETEPAEVSGNGQAKVGQ